MKKFLLSILTATTLVAAPQAVVFDFGGVLTNEIRKEPIVKFLRKSLHLSAEEFEIANQEKRRAVQEGMSDADFWRSFAKKKSIDLGSSWPDDFLAAFKEAMTINHEMYAIVEELKEKKIRVALLSNVENRIAIFLREAGYYEPFDPCLLSCDVGIDKPDPRIYELLLKKLALSAEDVVFIDDKLENVESAKQVGIDALLFKSTDQIRQELQKRELVN